MPLRPDGHLPYILSVPSAPVLYKYTDRQTDKSTVSASCGLVFCPYRVRCVEGVPIVVLRHHQGVNVGDAETHEDTDSDVSVHAHVASFLRLFLYIKDLDAVFPPEPTPAQRILLS